MGATSCMRRLLARRAAIDNGALFRDFANIAAGSRGWLGQIAVLCACHAYSFNGMNSPLMR